MNTSDYFAAMYMFIRDSFICLFIAAGLGAVFSYPLCFLGLPAAFALCFILLFVTSCFLLRRGIRPGLAALYDLMFRCFKREELVYTGFIQQYAVYAAPIKKERINPALSYCVLSFVKQGGKTLKLLYSQEDILRLNTAYSVLYAAHARIIITIAAIDDTKEKTPAAIPRAAKPLPVDHISLQDR
ncbi:MAG: hypothetical protein GX541_01145 [Clostridiales bacterium]|jgi:hypothetical protein|nr:hypothetical protein [Clostridiales bacterium]